jgi:hypothetical protein
MEDKFNVGDKVKCIAGIDDIRKEQNLTVAGAQLSWDGKEFLHFKEHHPERNYSSECFEKC